MAVKTIVVDKRLPNIGITVLVLIRDKKCALNRMVAEIDERGERTGKKQWLGDGSFVDSIIAWLPIPTFDQILEANKDVLQRMKEKGD